MCGTSIATGDDAKIAVRTAAVDFLEISSMAKTSVAARLENFDQRLVRVEQILPTLASKEDLNRAIAPLATKEDLKAFATSEYLQRAIDQAIALLATKEDLKAYAIREDLKPLATKEDLKAYATKEDLKPYATKEDLKPYATKADLLELRDELRRHMDVQTEAMRGDIRLLAEYVEHLATKISDR
ncbi:MAG TPA: hypothetical protein VKE96_01985 [Vicinamibacterales bacterium]|nr:hypothetical protein [Vicinamibacterales bacterium]